MDRSDAPTSRTGKSILLFSDGTGNSSGKLFKTNVWRTYEAVDLGLARPGQRVQVAYYDNGVGTAKFKPIAWLAGIFGFGLQRNIRALYRFVCRNWAEGDSIYCFGFSRGAFTIRLVAALLATRGIVTYATERELDARTRDVLRDFQKENEPNLIPYLTRFNRWVRTALIAAKRALVGPRYRIRTNFGGKEVAFVGVWDTVAAYGGPSAEVTRAIDNFIYPLTMTDQCLSRRVQNARHALCLDDERDAFHPVLWNEWDWANKALAECPGDEAAQEAFRRRMKQVWFAGMHSDVGGGYPDESLSYVSLAWMMKEAADCGVRFIPEIEKHVRDVSNSLGPIHNSRGGLASYYRYQPRRIEAFLHQSVIDRAHYEETRSYRDPIQGERDYPPRGFLLSCNVHESVAARIVYGTDDYAPIVLPPEFAIEPFNFEGAGGNPRVHPEEQDLLRLARPGWEDQRERVYDIVWWRRVVYFLTVFVTTLLVTLPLYAERFMLPRTIDGQWVVGRLTSWSNAIPGFLQPWVRAFQTSPIVFSVLLVLVIAGSVAGMSLERMIRSRMHRLWQRRRASPRGFRRLKPGWVQRLRTAKPYQRLIQDLKWYILPTAIGILMLLAIGYLVDALATQFWLSWRDPELCERSTANPYTLPAHSALPGPGAPFATNLLCNSTRVQVQGGQPYAVELAVPTVSGRSGPFPNWTDGGHPATPNGIPARNLKFWGYVGGPLRRLVDARYLQVLYQIRPKNLDEARHPVTVATLSFTAVDKRNPRCWIYRADFVARQPGELLLFVNDSIAIGDSARFYNNNQGTGRVYIHELHKLDGALDASAALQPDPCGLALPAGKPAR